MTFGKLSKNYNIREIWYIWQAIADKLSGMDNAAWLGTGEKMQI